MKNFITALLLMCIGFACNSRHVSKTKDKTDVHIESSITKADSVHIKTEIINEVSTYFGDTLKGSISFDETTTIDSIESGGIKVVAKLTNKGSTKRLDLKAIAKPMKFIDKGIVKQDFKQYQSGTQNILKDSTSTVQRKEVKSEPLGFT